MRIHRTALVASLLAAAAAGQSSSAATLVNHDGVGCQGFGGRLTNGVPAGGTGTYLYDASTGVLELTIENTTPPWPGQSTATISEIFLNVPPGAVTGATLTNQVGSGGATPSFSLSFDADTSTAPNPNTADCLGDFNISLTTGLLGGGIANPAASTIGTPNPVLGPVTFTIQLTGPGIGTIDAESFLAASSVSASPTTVATNFALRFDGGGPNSQDYGYSGSCDLCRTSVYVVGQPAIGQTFDICVTGGYACHACVWLSATPGPSVAGPYTVPIGLPIAAAYTLGNFGLGNAGNSLCISFTVPNNALLRGFEFYTSNVTYYALNVQGFGFSPARKITIN